MYSLSGLMAGTLQGKYWQSAAAVAYAGRQAEVAGAQFEDAVAEKGCGRARAPNSAGP